MVFSVWPAKISLGCVVHDLLQNCPFLVWWWVFLLFPMGEIIVDLQLKTFPMDDGTYFYIVEVGRLTFLLPVVLLSYSESHFWPQLLVIGPTVRSKHDMCTVDVHLIQTPHDDEVDNMRVSRRRTHPSGHPSAWTWCSSLSVRTQSTESVKARHWSGISQSHYLYKGCHWAHLPADCRRLPCFAISLSFLECTRW